MILIVTYKEDYTVDFLINKLNQQGRTFLRLNAEDIDQRIYTVSNETNFLFSVEGHLKFDAIWYRRLKLPDFDVDQITANYLAGEYDSLFKNIFHNISTDRWMSRPDALSMAENKVLQLRIAKDLGFCLPATLITNDRAQVQSFAHAHTVDGIVVKPLFSGRIEHGSSLELIYTNSVDSKHIDEINSFDLTPCIFQQQIPKLYEIRATIVDNKVFGARVDSQANEKTKIDWRRERLAFTPYELPIDIEHKCIDLVRQMNTYFGAIDLIKSTDGNYYFLENNPNGQWAWIEMDTGIPISQAIIDFLYGQEKQD